MLIALIRHTAGNPVEVRPVFTGTQDVGGPAGFGGGTQAAAGLDML